MLMLHVHVDRISSDLIGINVLEAKKEKVFQEVAYIRSYFCVHGTMFVTFFAVIPVKVSDFLHPKGCTVAPSCTNRVIPTEAR